MIRIALTKGRIEKKAIELLTEAGYDCSELEDKGRKLVFKLKNADIEARPHLYRAGKNGT